MQSLAEIKQRFTLAITQSSSLEALEAVRLEAIGKKGAITEVLKSLGSLPAEQRKQTGQAINAVKEEITALLTARKTELEASALEARLAAEKVDVTLPTRPQAQGSLHPVTHTIRQLQDIFGRMGFNAETGYDIEDDWHNFGALNFPPHHPARAMHDTFYLVENEKGEKPVLRTHTSPVQVRVMQSKPAPHRFIAYGRTYRSDSDQTHTPMFHQIEGLVIDKNITMAHLKGCLQQFLQEFFEVDAVKMRFRPSFFPFTEPSAEVDIGCAKSKDGLTIGEGNDWLEILGCGMVHQNVLRNCGLNPSEWQGFAFGIGIERLAMLKYGIPDLRTFYEGDSRWLSHYGNSL